MKPQRKQRIKRAKHLKQLRREAENKGRTVRQLHSDLYNSRICI